VHPRPALLDTPTIDLSNVLALISTIAVVFGVVFGLIELRQVLRQRRDQVAIDIIRTYLTQDIKRSLARVMTLPDDADPSLVNENPLMFEAVLAADSACEAWGSMVFEGVVDLHMFDRMAGGQVRGSWRRLRRWVEHQRELERSPNVGEWWQWLYERLEEDPDPGKAAGAHVSFRGWTRR
jgi:hypothetical protein